MRKAIGLLAVSVCTVWAGSAFAQGQIAPNPNPAGSTITLSSSGWFNNAIFDNEGTLNNNLGGALNNNLGGTLNNSGLLDNDGLLDNFDTLNNNFGGSLFNDGGTLNNGVGGTLNNNHSLFNNVSGTLNNFGALNNNLGGTLNNSGLLDNDGGSLNNYGTITSTGALNNNAGASMTLVRGVVNATTITNNGTFNLNGGALNVDTFNGDLNNTGATLGAGYLSSGTAIDGDYSQNADSKLLIDILDMTDFDVLNVSGAATLDGKLKMNSSYAGLAFGDSFEILVANNISGTFSSISNRRIGADWAWELDYGVDGAGNSIVTASVSQVPLPAAAWLFISAIAGLAGAKRLSRSKGAA